MTDGLCFATFSLLHDVPNICGVCTSKPPILRYEFCDGDEKPAEYMKGFCCASCASRLLSVLEDVERQEWAREQADPGSMVSN
jgi:hypothetical protein